MNIGFILLNKNTYKKKDTGVWGDEIVARALSKAIKKEGYYCDIYQYDEQVKLDVAIWMSHVIPHKFMKHKYNILWMQGFTTQGAGKVLPLDSQYEQIKNQYDIVMTASRVLANRYNIPFIFPGVDLEYYRCVYDNGLDIDVSFIGNLIKPHATIYKYLSPLSPFKYKLYGGDFGKISHEKSLKVISNSRINLHFGFEESIKWDMVTGRPFHISACIGFTMMDKVPFFMEKFKDAIAFTDGGEEEKEQIKKYVNNKNLRHIMAYRAYDITRKQFSNEVVGNKILEVLCRKQFI